MMFTTKNAEAHTQMCLTFILKVNYQGLVTDFRFSKIFDDLIDIVIVIIDTRDQVYAMFAAGSIKMNVCDLDFQGQPSR